MTPLEVWGGVECTVNRVADGWHSQLAMSGHDDRAGDIELIAQLGIRTLRYPVLWERAAARSAADIDWSWADERLALLRAHGITPIVGLVHHGSGPRYTSLIEDSFAPGLADFAGRVAERHPWLVHFTPVNEPLTTARFSTLYGHWYPHRRDDRAFARALINQCRATVLGMQAIRRHVPNARLVQTEDLGTVYGTAHMGYQARFDNERRWLTWDLLCGRVNAQHPLAEFLRRLQIDARELDWFVENPCPPSMLGINHYVTSDRFLDERLALYPATAHGGNARERYADLEAVRVMPREYGGWDVIKSAWERYRLPIALTEVHLGCTREEQLRWFKDAWTAAERARAAGCDVRAVTAWSLLGAFDWGSLLTRFEGSYEPGAFDVRAPLPRPTAIAHLIRRAVRDGRPEHPVLASHGWWQRPDKLTYGAVAGAVPHTTSRQGSAARDGSPAPVLICGAAGILGRALGQACQQRNLAMRGVGRAELDICDAGAIEEMLRQVRPWAVINAAGYVRVDHAEHETRRCFRENAAGAQALALAAERHGARFLTYSSDLVFDGGSSTPYTERARVAPLNAYGRSKAAAEELTLACRSTLCVRTAAFFGAWGRDDFVARMLRTLARGERFLAIDDVSVSPTYLPDLANASLDLLLDECIGIVHLTNQGALSWYEFARAAAAATKRDAARVEGRPLQSFALPAARPRYSALASERVYLMPTLADALSRYAQVSASPRPCCPAERAEPSKLEI